MMLAVQWAQDPPRPWEFVDSREWKNLPKKVEPPRDRTPVFNKKDKVIRFKGPVVDFDTCPGWLYRVCINGKCFREDHIAIYHDDTNQCVTVISWNDDPGDYEADEMHVEVWNCYPLPKDPVTSGLVYKQLYLTARKLHKLVDEKRVPIIQEGHKVELCNLVTFARPLEIAVRHGIWVTTKLADRLNAFSSPRWDAWKGLKF